LDDPGGALLARRAGRAFELIELLRVAIGAAEALRELHGRGIVHLDVRPAHMLVTAAGEVRLLGFGLAVRPGGGALAPTRGVAIGSLAYMAPEQPGRLAHAIDARADLYALGVPLYELASGAPPFTAADAGEWIHAHLARRPPPLESVPAMVAAII